MGIPLRLEYLRRELDVSSSGLSLLHLMQILGKYGIKTRGIKFESKNIEQLKLPAIISWAGVHFVVLEKIESGVMTLMDPAIGRRKYSVNDSSEFVFGFGLEIIAVDGNAVDVQHLNEINKNIENESSLNFGWGWYYHFISEFKYSLLKIFGLSLLCSFGLVVLAKLNMRFVSEVISSGMKSNILPMVGVFLFIVFIIVLFSILKFKMQNVLFQQMNFKFSNILINSIYNMPLNYFNKRSLASLLRKSKSADELFNYVNHFMNSFLVHLLLMLVVGSLMLSESFVLGGSVVVTGLILMFFRFLMVNYIKHQMYVVMECESRRNKSFLDSIKLIVGLKISQNIFHRNANYADENILYLEKQAKFDSFLKIQELLAWLSTILLSLIILSYGSQLFLSQQIILENLVMIFFLQVFFSKFMEESILGYIKVHLSKIELSQAKDVLIVDESKKIAFEEGLLSSGCESINSLVFSKVSYSYGSMENLILNELDLFINKGEKVFIAGESGCGKTTLIYLMCGLLKPQKGVVKLNDIDMSNNIVRYKSKIAVVLSQNEMMEGSVLDNILFGNAILDGLHLEYCLAITGLNEVLRKLPQGLNTVLGDNGVQLSSGQKQRIFLARAFYQKPELLILDEPTAHLDRTSKLSILSEIKKMSAAVLLVSHLSEDFEICSRGYKFQNGKLMDA